mmetsp:Transcript_24945/g.54397  ORF Transcript_24945/g.54397 Transcript_24945/m.54397 type:complete len:709 (-) Transcript_24945:63-2189(-)
MASHGSDTPPFATPPAPMNDANRHASSSSADESGDDLFLDAFADRDAFAIGDDDEDNNENNEEPLFPDEDEDAVTQQGETGAVADVSPDSQTDPHSFSIDDEDEDSENTNTRSEKDICISDVDSSPSLAANTEAETNKNQTSTSPTVSPALFDDVDIDGEDTTDVSTEPVSCEPTSSVATESTALNNTSPISVVTSIKPTPTQQRVSTQNTDDKDGAVPETGSGESWEPVKDEVSMNNAIQYEVLPGLFAHLSDDAVIGLHDVDSYAQSGDDCQHFDLLVSAKKICLGCGSFLLGKDISAGDGYFITGCDVTLRAQVEKPRNARDAWDVVVRDLDISITGGLELDTLAERAHVVSFLEKFGCTPTVSEGKSTGSRDKSTTPQQQSPARRLTKEEWQQFLRNVQEDKRAKDTKVQGESEVVDTSSQAHCATSRDPSSVDFLIPYAKVWGVSCMISKEKTIDFPHCEGTAKCTLRTLLEYYFRSILNTIDEGSRGNVQLDGKNSVADLTSVKASIVGAAAGAAVLGPIGFLAGSYLGSQLGRKHSGTVVGATAGACLFGPVGLIAGACYGESTRSMSGASRGERSAAAFGQSATDSGGIAKAATKHVSSNKYEYAGTAGVVAGAAAGSVAGPIGMLTGAYLGSVSARKVTENASSAAAEVSETEGRREYRFGDITRGLVARGKQARGADKEEGYQFGDFTRGFFGGGKGK